MKTGTKDPDGRHNPETGVLTPTVHYGSGPRWDPGAVW